MIDPIALDFSDARIRGFVAGLRPYRAGSPRLEVERLGAKTVLHNYGHGGSGITMCWGAAEEGVEMLSPALSPGAPVAVLGAGALGLCCATLLRRRGQQVTVLARDFPPRTTSNVAGGLWAPASVGSSTDPGETARQDRILRRTWHTFRALDANLYGVEEAPMYESDDRLYPLDPLPSDLIGPPRRLERLPFTGRPVGGLVSTTLLIQTPRFLDTLMRELKGGGVTFLETTLEGPEDLAELPQEVVVNCLGLGAREVVPDLSVKPIRGQLILLDPAPRSFMLDHSDGYLISRRDVLIVGGTFEEGVEDTQPVQEVCQEILNRTRRRFTG